jgi:hypothetical protein
LSNALEKIARQALYDDDFARGKSLCQRWVRQCIQAVYGDRFDAFHKASAKESAAHWRKSKYWLVGSHPSVPGDIWYWTTPEHGEYGHVAIRVTGNKVAENSVLHYGDDGDGRGTRSLSIITKPTLIVRLPSPERVQNGA